MHFAFQRNWGLKLWVALGLALWALVGLAQTAPQVLFKTSMGNFSVEVYPDKAPKTVDNFLRYVKDKHYDGTVFHRVMDGFMVQGGGFTADMKQKPTREPVALEAMNGLKNEVGTIAMARTANPNSATSQPRLKRPPTRWLRLHRVWQSGFWHGCGQQNPSCASG